MSDTAVAAAAPIADADAAAAAPPSVKLTKAQRKKANRKAAKRAANATVTQLLSECAALRDDTVMGRWFAGFRRYKQRYRVYYLTPAEMSDACVEWAFRLTRLNMQRMYEQAEGWGWSDKDKLAECQHADARYFILTQVAEGDADAASGASPTTSSPASGADVAFEGEPVAFCHVRFVTGEDDRAPIAYIYELQLEAEVQRQGIGRFLMSLVELFAWRCQLQRVVLTVFQRNHAAMRLYTHALRYTLDATDPSLFDEDAPYSILAKQSPKVKSIADIRLPLVDNTPAADATPT